MTTLNATTRTQPNASANPVSETSVGKERPGEQTTKTAKELGGMAKDAAKETNGHMKESVSERIEAGQEKLEEVGQSIEQSIRENPLKFILIAAGVGVVIGRFFMRR